MLVSPTLSRIGLHNDFLVIHARSSSRVRVLLLPDLVGEPLLILPLCVVTGNFHAIVYAQFAHLCRPIEVRVITPSEGYTPTSESEIARAKALGPNLVR